MSKKHRTAKETCEISAELNKELEKINRRSRYITYLDNKHNLLYFNALDSDDVLGSDIVVDKNVDVEAEALKHIALEKLKTVLKTLNNDELILIKALIYQEKSEREVSNLLGISHTAVGKRWDKLKEKLKRLMEN